MSAALLELRGAIGLGATWAVAWAAFAAALVAVVAVVAPEQVDEGEGPLVAGGIFAMIGFLSGVGFGLLLAFAERGKPVLALAPSRAALWGILASAAFPLLTGRADQVFITCSLGAAVAVTLVAVARRAARLGATGASAFVLAVVRDAVGTRQKRPA